MLSYSCPKPVAALMRTTTADEEGNLTMEHEAAILNVLSIAQSAESSPMRDFVAAQVMRVARKGTLRLRDVIVPGPLADYVVAAPYSAEYHSQTDSILYDPTISGELAPPEEYVRSAVLPHGARKVIARRVALGLVRLVTVLGRPILVNLVIGIPAEVASVLAEESIEDFVYTTVESGPFGGVAPTGLDFGASRGFFALVQMADMFSMYEGGIIDAASLGFMQVDRRGNVNPASLPGRMPGAGGFPAIAYGAPDLFFAGEFTAGSKLVEVSEKGTRIVKDGGVVKFVKSVYKVVYSGQLGVRRSQNVIFVTERAVFKLTRDGLELLEVAPGVDLDRDVISKMGFEPNIGRNLREMSSELFAERSIGSKRLLAGATQEVGT